MTKKLTIIDIAKLAGVGKSTVSRVINHDPKVSVQTRQKVEQVIANVGFIPSKSAQSMRGGPQKVVGIIVSRLDSTSENQAVRGMLNVLYASGYDSMIMESQFQSSLVHEHLDILHKRQVDGVILFGFTGCELSKLSRWQDKLVLMAWESEQLSCVNYDNHGVIELALDKLYQQGMRNIGFMGVDPKDMTTGLARQNAYQNWCEKHQLNCYMQSADLDIESGYQKVDSLLTPNMDAICCATDSLALGVNKRLHELNQSHIKVSGVGSTPLLSFLYPQTLSIDPGYYQAGQLCAKQLLKRFQGHDSIEHILQAPILF